MSKLDGDVGTGLVGEHSPDWSRAQGKLIGWLTGAPACKFRD